LNLESTRGEKGKRGEGSKPETKTHLQIVISVRKILAPIHVLRCSPKEVLKEDETKRESLKKGGYS